YRLAIKFGERQQHVLARTVTLLQKNNRYDEAKKVLEELRQKHPASVDLTKIDAMQSLQMQDIERALPLAEQVVEKAPTYQNWMWLGQMRREARKMADAQKAFQKATELAPHVPETWIEYVKCLRQMNQIDKAKEAVQEALKKLPKDQGPPTAAACYEFLGLRNEAEQQYLASVEVNRDDLKPVQNLIDFYLRGNQILKAETHLRKLINDPKVPEEMVLKLRRVLAYGLAVNGNNRLFPEAERLIEENLKAKATTLDDRRTKG